MKNRHPAGFVWIELVLILLVLGIIGFVGYQVYKSKTAEPANEQPESVSQSPSNVKENTCQTDFGEIKTPRESAEGAFTTAITDINQIALISSGKYIGDQRNTYLQIKDQQRVPVYAPADGVLVWISYKTRVDVGALSAPDYDLLFIVDCKTMYRINHITDPNKDIAALSPISEPQRLGPGLPAPSDADTKPKTNMTVKAGQQLGTTTGTPGAHNWDFALFIDKKAVCPYEKFQEPIRSDWLALFGNAKINSTKPIPGTPCEVNGNY